MTLQNYIEKFSRKNNNVRHISGEITKKCESRYIFRKARDRNEKLPLLVYLHPAGGGYSTSWSSMLPSDVPDFRQDFYYLHPLAEDIFHADNVYFTITEMCKKYPNIDTNRIYGIGYSMGGRCLWNLAIAYPDLFAGIVPICGFSCYLAASRIAHVPSWIHHGDQDFVVPMEESSKMYRALVDAAKDPNIHNGTIYRGAGHEIYPRCIKDGRVLEWLFQQAKKR